jgi:Putative redox-active protein (C_GCAxxG_C_C).
MYELINSRVHDYYWNQDLSCAVTTLKILSELFYPELHPQVIEATFGLNAGRFGSQCGLVEGTLLFIGSYGHHKNMTKEQIADLCHEFCSKFQPRFGSLLCNELRPQGFSPDNPPHLCENLTKKAIIFSAEFIREKAV